MIAKLLLKEAPKKKEKKEDPDNIHHCIDAGQYMYAL